MAQSKLGLTSPAWLCLAGLAWGCGSTSQSSGSAQGGSATSAGGAGSGATGTGGSGNTTNGGGGSVAGTTGTAVTGGSGNTTNGGSSATGGVPSVTGGVPSVTGGSGGQSTSGKLDVLFVIDNSLSMADKQELLVRPVPELVQRLVNPRCVDGSGRPVGTQPAMPTDACSTGSREFPPVTDLHVGVVTSALGGRGKACTPGSTVNPFDDDRGELIPPLRNAPHDGQGFLAYTGTQPVDTFLANATADIAAAGEQGCGYESTEEAWYRFLVDPEPPSAVVLQGGLTVAVTSPLDTTLLTQRAAFLRPDSAVVIVVLTDENDCSVIDYGQGWLIADNSQAIPRPTSQCANNPNDPCCRNCQQAGDAYANCPAPSSDPNCGADDGDGNGPGYIGLKNNAPNLRCWQTKRRFGFDLLFPIQRYIDGLTRSTVSNRSGAEVPNPLFAGGRDPSLVTLVGIVGVPWQDLATDATRDVPGELELMAYDELTARNRWAVILGDPHASPPVLPTDPFMVESIDARSGTNPITGQPIVASTSQNPQATINGHEFNVNPNTRDDLQYTCIFPLVTPRDCTLPAYTSTDPTQRKGCDCRASVTDNVVDRNRPLCQPPAGGPATTNQYYAKAYAGGRHLEILKGLGPRGIVGSICPRNTATPGSQDYGYGPVVQALMTRLRQVLR
jgi:hypothetical protein